MMKRWTGPLAAVVALAAPSAVLAAAVSITTCGGTIPAGQRLTSSRRRSCRGLASRVRSGYPQPKRAA